MPVEANCIKRTQGRKELCLTVEVKALTVARRKRERVERGLSLRDNQPRVGWGGVVTGRMWHISYCLSGPSGCEVEKRLEDQR